jgi:hypothetical protein
MEGSLGVVGLLVLSGGVAWVRARGRFLTMEEAMVRLESRLGMHNALSAAMAGVRGWPEVPGEVADGLRFDWRRTVLPLAVAAGLSVLAFMVPVSVEAGERLAMPPPVSHEEIRAAIEALKETVSEQAIEELEEQLKALEEKPAGEQYSHGSLEAADALRDGVRSEAGRQGERLASAAKQLEKLSAAESAAGAEEQARQAQEFASTLKGLAESKLGLSERLREALEKIDPASVPKMDAGALKELKEQLEAAAGQCEKAGEGQGEGEGEGDGEGEGEGEGKGKGKGKGQGEGEGEGEGEGQGEGEGEGEGEGDGKGGVARGPGTSPLGGGAESERLGEGALENLPGQETRAPLPGDVIRTEDAKHELDRTPVGPQSGGAAGQGEGGAALWQEALLPAEKAVLQRYFK